MSRNVVMFDVDGVLADFVQGFTLLANKMFGTRIITTPEQPSWNFRSYGLLTRGEEHLVWEKLKKDPSWWIGLLPLCDFKVFNRINRLSSTCEVVFCTNRTSDARPAGFQTKVWLIQQGISFPNVVVSARKGEIARAIGATHSIDDKIENVWAVHWIADEPTQCKSFVLDRPYNQIQERPEIGPAGVRRIKSVEEFLDDVEGSR